jgi:hypothetical protein
VAYELTDEDRLHFKEHGFFVLRGAIESGFMEKVSDSIWSAMPGHRDDPDSWEELEGHKPLDAPDVCFSGPALEYAWHENLWGVAQQFFGKGRVEEPDGIAVLLNYPQPEVEWKLPSAGHLDGYAVSKRVDAFTLGVTGYADAVRSHGGAFVFWPGSPNRYNNYFQENPRLPHPVHLPDLGEAVEFLGEPGDLVFWHTHMWHTVSPNASDRVRTGLFIRYRDLNRENTFDARNEDMWHDWPGVPSG